MGPGTGDTGSSALGTACEAGLSPVSPQAEHSLKQVPTESRPPEEEHIETVEELREPEESTWLRVGIVTTELNIKRHKPIQDVTFPNRCEELGGGARCWHKRLRKG